MKVLPFFCDITGVFTAAGMMNSPTQTAGHEAQSCDKDIWLPGTNALAAVTMSVIPC